MTTDKLGRMMPNDIEAEMALLGTVLLDGSILDESVEIVKAKDFYRPANSTIYAAMIDMRSRGIEIDTLTLRAFLDDFGVTEKCGGATYLLELADTCSVSSNWSEYAKIVKSNSLRRSLVHAGTEITAIGYDGTPDAESDVSKALSIVHHLADDNVKREARDMDDISTTFLAQLKNGKKEFITPKGVPEARMEGGDLVIISAGTSVGKTAIALDWVDEWSTEKSVTFFEYEMREEQLFARLICKHAKVSMQQIKEGDLTPEEVERIEVEAKKLKKRNLRVEEVWCDNQTLFGKIRRAAQSGTDIVVIDHLGLIPIANRVAGMNEAKVIGHEVTNILKRLASELNIIIVLLVQLNREGQKDIGFPKKYHLRDSGEIENDASLILMLWSESQIAEDWSKRVTLREKSGIVETSDIQNNEFYLVRIGIEKNRNGELKPYYGKYTGKHFTYEYPADKPMQYVYGKMFN